MTLNDSPVHLQRACERYQGFGNLYRKDHLPFRDRYRTLYPKRLLDVPVCLPSGNAESIYDQR